MQVVILDKETFPRDKYCGDAVCTPALRILDDMGVTKVLADNNESHYADAGGFVSPSGLSYIGVALPSTVASCMHLPGTPKPVDYGAGLIARLMVIHTLETTSDVSFASATIHQSARLC